MKKQLLLLLLTLLPMAANAHDIAIENADGVTIYYNYINNGDELEVTKSNNFAHLYSGDVIIPEEVIYLDRTLKVTSIGEWAFFHSNLTSVTIPVNVTSIGNGAFASCENLTSIIVSSGNSEYDSNNNCNAIIETSSKRLISGCKNTFIPNNVTSIGKYAFHGCSGLTSITIPNSVRSIEESAFSGCTCLTSVTIGDGVSNINDFAFQGCTSLTSITIPGNVEYIGGSDFQGCTSLASITIGEGVTTIGSSAFKGCTSLTSITIPNSLTLIGNDAFAGCNLRVVNRVINDIALWCLTDPISYGNGQSNPLLNNNPNIEIHLYRDAVTEITNLIIPDGVTSIRSSAFEGCRNLTSVTIPNSVTSIGERAFSSCTGLTSVTIPNNVTSISEGTFYGCGGLTSVTVGNGVISIGNQAFAECNSLISFTIPNSVTSIGNRAFQHCLNLNSLIFGENLMSIGYEVFAGCININSIYISNLSAWCGYSFSSSIAYLGIEPSSPPIKYSLYINGILTKELIIPNGVTSISKKAFDGCTSIKTVTIPNSVTAIDYQAFANCDNLLTVKSEITEPFNCKDVFSTETLRKGTLIVPAGTKELYTRFDGWREFLKIEEVGTAVPQQYILSFVVDNKELSKQEMEAGATITPPAKDTDGNEVAWYTYPATMPAHDLVVYGMVPKPDAPTKYTLTYVLDGETYKSVIVEEGATVSKEKAPYKEGYTFNGWQDEPTTMPGNDVTVNGTFSVNSYSLKFVVDNTELSAQSVQYGSTITAPTKDSEGKDVTWYTYPTTMPAHDLVIYGIAIIQPEPEVFVWLTVKDGQSGTTKIEVKQGTEQRLNINPEEGWKLSAIMMDNDYVTAQLQSDGTFVTPALMSDATLTIVYEQETPSGVRTTTHSQAQIKVVSDGVVISNAVPDTRCVVYQTDGQQVVNTVINEGTRKITLQKGQAYILSIDGRTLKFAL